MGWDVFMDLFHSTVYFLLCETLVVFIGTSSAFIKVPLSVIHGIKGEPLVLLVEYTFPTEGQNIQGNWQLRRANNTMHLVTFRDSLPIHDMAMESINKFSLHPPNASLLINKLEDSDDGEYTIQVNVKYKDLVKSQNKTIRVTVNVPVSKPAVHMEPASAAVEDVDNVTMTCSVEFGTRVAYQWLLGGSPIPANPRYTFSEDHRKLVISLAKKEDIGKYICVASNLVSKMWSEPTQLNVFYGPYHVKVNSDIELKVRQVFTVNAGETILFHCSADSNPPNSYVWIHKVNNMTKEIMTGPHFVVNSGEITLTNEYMCCAYNNVTKKQDETQFTVIVANLGNGKEKLAQKAGFVSPLAVITTLSIITIVFMLFVFLWRRFHPKKVIKQMYTRPLMEQKRPHLSGHEDATDDFGIYEFIAIPGTSEPTRVSNRSLSNLDSVHGPNSHTTIYEVIRHVPEASSTAPVK
ncbi:HEPACAM family member 2-like isoform X1 [Acipenser ruthenus]|uniref:HEPACAM family member 2-like isoform X1 n=1 Tax=Acipenser ruthenus TaxID=7906 RepID=UPI0027403822|nr:HEPACAM family member 2-like isoform X1 [Acipenser ruthenus]